MPRAPYYRVFPCTHSTEDRVALRVRLGSKGVSASRECAQLEVSVSTAMPVEIERHQPVTRSGQQHPQSASYSTCGAPIDNKVVAFLRFNSKRLGKAAVSQLSDNPALFGRNVRLMRLRRGETVLAVFPAQTPTLPFGIVIICAVLSVLSAVPIPRSHSESRTPRCGCADHHIAS
jgi:hypothetical protein